MQLAWRWLHLVAAGFWLGGLVMLAIVTVSGLRELDRSSFRSLIRRVGRTFLAGSVIAWALLGLSGVALATAHLRGLGELASTAYGRTLSAKTILFLLAIGATLVHTAAGSGNSPAMIRLSRAMSPLILLLTVAIYYLAVRLTAG